MKSFTRRAFAPLFAALAAAQQRSQPGGNSEKLPSKAYPFEELMPRQTGQMTAYQILKGSTHSGFELDLHETELAPGGVPHPPHSHVHEELLFVREGELEVILNGRTTRLGAGSCAYLASNDLHGYRNPGAAPAKYFVLALGTD
jgi:quercetin dioxygenase-like cupin family protein